MLQFPFLGPIGPPTPLKSVHTFPALFFFNTFEKFKESGMQHSILLHHSILNTVRHRQGSEMVARIDQLKAWVQILDRPSALESRLGTRLDSKQGLTKPLHVIIEKVIDLTIDFQKYLKIK